MQILSVLARRNVPLDGFESAVAFYERLFGEEARLRTEVPEAELRVAQICAMLVVGMGPGAPAGTADIGATYLVDGLRAWEEALPSMGAETVVPPVRVSTGQLMIVRHPDGSLVEYVEHTDKHPLDRMVRGVPNEIES